MVQPYLRRADTDSQKRELRETVHKIGIVDSRRYRVIETHVVEYALFVDGWRGGYHSARAERVVDRQLPPCFLASIPKSLIII